LYQYNVDSFHSHAYEKIVEINLTYVTFKMFLFSLIEDDGPDNFQWD